MSRAQTGRDRGDNDPAPTRPVLFSLKIGFFAGLIWGLVRWLAAGLNFTDVNAAFLLDPFVPNRVLGGAFWQFAGWAAFILMSLLAGLVYLGLFRKIGGPWPGLVFGAAWWGLVYAWAGPFVGAVPPLRRIGWHSIATDFCLFLLWGLFIGYSIAFELHNESKREPEQGAPQPSA